MTDTAVMITNALSVDLEEYFQVSNLSSVIGRERWDGLPSRVEASTRRMLDAFDEHGQRATFFTLGWVADRNPRLVREIAERGHELACHGYAHELVYELGPERFRADLRRSRAAIEQASGRSLSGYRAPSYSITRASLWALPILVEEGFRFDSSIFPVRHHRYGIPGFERAPVRLDLPGGGSIVEFPLTTLRLGPLTLPMAGGAYLRLLPAWLFRWGFGRLAGSGFPTVLYLHPWEIDPEQPIQPVGRRVRWNHYHNLDRMEERLRTLLERYRFAPMGEVLGALEVSGRMGSLRLDSEGKRPGRA
ncbi:MAG TPA: XrtA system polysaccharide deacetylase [Myxococcota bacterium]|nr:XrtA system polysaccharide deacetylase [Myxococcota bacterium]